MRCRDELLACGGLLDDRMGGPGFRLQGLDDPSDYSELQGPPGTLTAIYRRGIYAIVKRTACDPLLTTFDAPDGTSSCPLRLRTDTPLQALSLLNDPLFVSSAQKLAGRVGNSSGETPAQIRELFLTCTAREPRPSELKTLADLFEAHAATNMSVSPSRPRVRPDPLRRQPRRALHRLPPGTWWRGPF